MDNNRRPLSPYEILTPLATDENKLLSFDVGRAAHHTVTANDAAKLWIADIRWFSLPLILLALVSTGSAASATRCAE